MSKRKTYLIGIVLFTLLCMALMQAAAAAKRAQEQQNV